MPSEKHLLIDDQEDLSLDTFHAESSAGAPRWSVNFRKLRGGVSEGVEVLEIRTDRVSCDILPTRGMGLWRATLDGVPLGWRSPIPKPVHPAYVPLTEPTGLGLLDGLTELVFRCGLESSGAPDFEPDGRLRFPLHGRIANTPTSNLTVEIDGESPVIRVVGQVAERRFLGQKLLMTTEYVIIPTTGALQWTDSVENVGGVPAVMQMLYHINLGKPFLKPGAHVVAPAIRVCPRDEIARQGGVDSWAIIPSQRGDFAEQVYFLQLLGDSQGHTSVVFKDASGTSGIGLEFNIRELPCFTLWKNSQSDEDGFVAGLEPGTNYPNPRSFEEKHGRIVSLPPQATWQSTLTMRGYATPEGATNAATEALSLLDGKPTEHCSSPDPSWSVHA